MTVKAKAVLSNKFWILEENGKRIGTISHTDDQYMFTDSSQTKFFENSIELKKFLGVDLEKCEVTFVSNQDYDVHGFPTSVEPYNTVYDIKRKLPLFTKSDKSKSLYCAGYYIIKFDKGWVKSFCPKLITIEKYEFRGPFNTKFKMKEELHRAS